MWRTASILIGWASRRSWNNDPRRHADVIIAHPYILWRHYESIDQWRHIYSIFFRHVATLFPSLLGVAQRRGHGESFVVVPRLIHIESDAFPTPADFPKLFQDFAIRRKKRGPKLPNPRYVTLLLLYKFDSFFTNFSRKSFVANCRLRVIGQIKLLLCHNL